MSPNFVRFKLRNDLRWLVRAILAIAARQTDHEYENETTRLRNKRGFNSADAPEMTKMAKQIKERQQRGDPHHRLLDNNQLDYARDRMPKYARQLCRVAREKAAQKQPA